VNTRAVKDEINTESTVEALDNLKMCTFFLMPYISGSFLPVALIKKD
jgi:hypothetical protein